ncbi:FHIPEP family type III secretion protein, partial [Lutimaribacter sp. EGI FJ00014]|nr:FHIPEP family type III secretion protein [Lutimaribacter sp. EGI FJ00014]
MITRVTGGDDQSDLGRQITGQLLRDGRTLTSGAVILIALSLVPGFPSAVFLVLGIAMGAGAYGLYRKSRNEEIVDLTPLSTSAPAQARDNGIDALETREQLALPLLHRVVVRLGRDLGELVSSTDFAKESQRVHQDILEDLGIETPAIALHIDDKLDPQRVRMDLEGAPILT